MGPSLVAEDTDPGQDQILSPRRRRLLQWLTGGFLSLWGFGFLFVVASFLKPPRTRRELAERRLRVGSLDELPVGEARMVRHGREPIWVIRTGEDALVGLAGVCTHLHCILNWDPKQRSLLCPCHQGAFDLNGNVLKGPPPRALQRFEVHDQLGVIYVHL